MTEDDVFDARGQQIDDINSLFEYMDEVVLGHQDDTPEDEDDDREQNFLIIKSVDYFYQQTSFSIEEVSFTLLSIPMYSRYANTKLPAISFEIITPPPEV